MLGLNEQLEYLKSENSSLFCLIIATCTTVSIKVHLCAITVQIYQQKIPASNPHRCICIDTLFTHCLNENWHIYLRLMWRDSKWSGRHFRHHRNYQRWLTIVFILRKKNYTNYFHKKIRVWAEPQGLSNCQHLVLIFP